jgi:hypothetical protein
MTPQEKAQHLEEIMTEVLLFAFVDNGFTTYAAAQRVAGDLNLDLLMRQSDLISSFDLSQPLTFEGLIFEGHFNRNLATLKLDTSEWINKVAAMALGKDNLETHYWDSSGKVWSDRGTSRKYKRMRMDMPDEPARRMGVPAGHTANAGNRRPGREGLGPGVDPDRHTTLFDHRRRLQYITDNFAGKPLTTLEPHQTQTSQPHHVLTQIPTLLHRQRRRLNFERPACTGRGRWYEARIIPHLEEGLFT